LRPIIRHVRSRLAALAGGVTLAALAGAAGPAPGTPRPGDPAALITGEGYRAAVATLASDAFEGRKPGQPGEQKTLDWIEAQYKALGLVPASPAGYRQPVPLVEITAAPNAVLGVAGRGGKAEFQYADDMVVWTKRAVPETRLDDSPLVFVGYGIVAPEVGWNDYAGIDMHGKTAVILINDPDFDGEPPTLFKGKAMTYYGRWTYKFEEAARQGAAGALIVHETAPAAYGWDVVRNSNTGPKLDTDTPDGNASRAAVEGWVQLDAARKIFSLAGADFDALHRAARQQGFKPVPLDARANVTVRNVIRRAKSANVLGVLKGAKRPDEYVLYMAHWDHFGKVLAFGGDPDKIFNGAQDNATGVAGILEIAKAFAGAKRRPDRSIAFLAVTGEEQGLLGSEYYAKNPLLPLASTAAAINIDALAPYGRTRDVEVIGFGQSELEDYLKAAAARQGRVLKPDSQPEKGFFFRSDHFNLAKVGVPALYIESGQDGITHSAEWIAAQRDEYLAKRYHKPADEYDPSWDVDGNIEDLRLLYEVGSRVANQTRWPQWYATSEFKAARDKSRAGATVTAR
jgi:Zn-dependent M28 family amino/carboxypeptidase